MAKILSDNIYIKQYGDEERDILYDRATIDGFLGGRLMEKQNDFNGFLQKLEETCLTKSDKEAVSILPQTLKAVREYADKLAKELGSSAERGLFLRFAEARGSQTLTILKKLTAQKAQNYKRGEVVTYCTFLIKSSEDLYDNPQVLAENADYYAGYIRLLPEYDGADTQSAAIDSVYSTAIQASINSGNCAPAKAYLNDKKIADAISEEKRAKFISAIALSEENELVNAIASRFNPQTEKELNYSLGEIQKSARNGLIDKNHAEKIMREITLAFNVFMKNKKESERDYEEKTALALLGKIITAEIRVADITDSGLSENVRNMISGIIETENAANTSSMREKKKDTLENLLKAAAQGEITTVSDIAFKNPRFLDAAALLRTIKAIKNYRNEKYDFKETL